MMKFALVTALRVRMRAILAAVTALCLAGPGVAVAEPYVFLGGAWADGNAATFRDSGDPPGGAAAFYGPGYRSRGDFADGAYLEAGAGWSFDHGLRLSGSIGWLPSIDYSGASNFLDGTAFAGTGERVRGTAESWTLFADAQLDLAAAFGWTDLPVRPFIGGGLGVAWNRLDPMVFTFPGLDQTTTTPGGDRTNFAWRAGAGVSIPLDARLSLDLSWRYMDLGRVGTDAGDITVRRSTGTSRVAVGETEADLTMHLFGAALRWQF